MKYRRDWSSVVTRCCRLFRTLTEELFCENKTNCVLCRNKHFYHVTFVPFVSTSLVRSLNYTPESKRFSMHHICAVVQCLHKKTETNSTWTMLSLFRADQSLQVDATHHSLDHINQERIWKFGDLFRPRHKCIRSMLWLEMPSELYSLTLTRSMSSFPNPNCN